MPKRPWTLLALLSCLVIIVVTAHGFLSSLPVYKELGIPVNPTQALAWREVGLALFFIGILLGLKPLRNLGSAHIVLFTSVSLATLLTKSITAIPQLPLAAQWLALISLVNNTLFRISLISVFLFLLLKPISDIPKFVMALLCETTVLTLCLQVYSFAMVLPRLSFTAGILLTTANLTLLIWFVLLYFSWNKLVTHSHNIDR